MFPLADNDGTSSYIAVNFIILASVEILAPHVFQQIAKVRPSVSSDLIGSLIRD